MDAAIEGGIAGARPDITDIVNKAKSRLGPMAKFAPGKKALKGGLGWFGWDVAFPDALGGEQDYESGRTGDVLLGPRVENIGQDEPIPELDGWSILELSQDPEVIALAEEFNVEPLQYAADIADRFIFGDTEGPYSPRELPWEYIEEQYGDTPWFQEYKENVPWFDSTARGFDKYVNAPLSDAIYGIGGLFNKLGEGAKRTDTSNLLLGP